MIIIQEAAKYFSMMGLSGSVAKHGLVSPKHMRYAALNPSSRNTQAMAVGTLAHSICNLSQSIEDQLAVMPDFHLDPQNKTSGGQTSTSRQTRYCKEKAAEWEQQNAGKIIATADLYNKAKAIHESLMENETAASLINRCENEVTVTATVNNVQCKGLIDLWNLNTLWADIKTTFSVQPEHFRRTFRRYKYGFKLAFYTRLMMENGFRPDCPILIAVESIPPYDVVLYQMSQAMLDEELDRVDAVIQMYADCEKANCWPGISNRMESLEDDEDLGSWIETSTRASSGESLRQIS